MGAETLVDVIGLASTAAIIIAEGRAVDETVLGISLEGFGALLEASVEDESVALSFASSAWRELSKS